VLAEWAGVEVATASAEATPAAETASDTPAEEAPAVEPAAEAPAAAAPADTGALLAAAAEKMGMPESMVERSAGARAKAQGTTVEAVLAEWAGVEAPSPPAAPEAEAEAGTTSATTEATAEAEEPSTGPDVEVLGEVDESPASKPSEPAEHDDLEPEEEAVAAGALPRWIAALFVFIPAFAIAYALFLPNGPNCGDAGSLAVDPVTGVAVNCDLSEFGSTVADFFAVGLDTYNGIGCVACHGAGGGGVANFPAFTGGSLLSTFPEGQCDAQIEWISLGTANWPDATYGATDKPVGGSGAVMPGFEGTLDPEEIAAVALYERVAFGGQDLEAALTDCGLAAGAEGGDTAAAGG
jgi:mono/diheme cytochrome c family protein